MSVQDAFISMSSKYPYGWAHGMVVSDYDPTRKYCMYCGSALVQNKEAQFYDTTTGEPQYKWTLGCPRYADNGWHDHWWRWDDPGTIGLVEPRPWDDEHEVNLEPLAKSMARTMVGDYEECEHGREYKSRGLCNHPDHEPAPLIQYEPKKRRNIIMRFLGK